MDVDTLKKKLQKQNPLMMSPMAFALAACGGGGGESGSNSNSSSNSPSNGINILAREIETNDTFSTANIVNVGSYNGSFGGSDIVDRYFFKADVTGSYYFNLEQVDGSAREEHMVAISDTNGTILAAQTSYTEDTNLFVHMEQHDGIYLSIIGGDDFNEVTYDLNIMKSDLVVEQEPNSGMEPGYINQTLSSSLASTFPNNVSIVGQLSSADDVDFFKFIASENSSTVIVDAGDDLSYVTIFQGDIDGDPVTLFTGETGDNVNNLELGSLITSFGTTPGDEYIVAISNALDWDTWNYHLKFIDGVVVQENPEDALPAISFIERDTEQSVLDFDRVTFDRPSGTFTMHLEDALYFDAAVDDILNGTSVMKYAIAFGNTNSEDDFHARTTYYSYDWVDAENITANNTDPWNDLLKQITVTDDALRTTTIDSRYDYISFGIHTDNVWVVEDFAIADGTII